MASQPLPWNNSCSYQDIDICADVLHVGDNLRSVGPFLDHGNAISVAALQKFGTVKLFDFNEC
jgi:hypothetical protein